MGKPNMGLDFTYYTYVSRDTAHAQCKFCQQIWSIISVTKFQKKPFQKGR